MPFPNTLSSLICYARRKQPARARQAMPPRCSSPESRSSCALSPGRGTRSRPCPGSRGRGPPEEASQVQSLRPCRRAQTAYPPQTAAENGRNVRWARRTRHPSCTAADKENQSVLIKPCAPRTRRMMTLGVLTSRVPRLS